MTPQKFRQKQKELLGEGNLQTGGAPTFTDPQLDSWRDDEVNSLYSKGLYRVGSSRTIAGWVEPTISSDTLRYYALPTGMRNVFRINYLEVGTEYVWGSAKSWDIEDAGFVRLDDAPNHSGHKIRMIGEIEYTGVDDPFMKQEVIDVCLFGSVIRALTGEYVKRQKAHRSRTSTRTTDASPGAIAAGIQNVRVLYNDAVGNALKIQRTFSLPTR